MATRPIVVLIAALAINIETVSLVRADEPAITAYGQINAQAPDQLKLFSFLVGRWKGAGKTRLADGNQAHFEVTWIGRYILNGVAIADEFHSLTPDGKPYLGISVRRYDTKHDSWIIEYLNVSNSFIRRQVNPDSGSVSLDAGSIVVISEDGQTRIRERYRMPDPNHFTYSTDISRNGGRSWEAVALEIAMTRMTDTSG